MKNKKPSVNPNIKKNKSLHKNKQKVSKSIVKKQFVSKHMTSDPLLNESISLQKDYDPISTYEETGESIQFNSDVEEVNPIDVFEENHMDLVPETNESILPSTHEIEDTDIKMNELMDDPDPKLNDEIDVNNIAPFDENFEDIKYKDISTDDSDEKIAFNFKDISNEDFTEKPLEDKFFNKTLDEEEYYIQEIPKDNYETDSSKDNLIDVKKEENPIEEPIEIIKDNNIDKIKGDYKGYESTVTAVKNDELSKNNLFTMNPDQKTITIDNKQPYIPEKEIVETYQANRQIFPHGFLRGTFFTIIFVAITLVLFTVPFIIAYLGLGFLLVISSLSIGAAALVYLENYNTGIKILLQQIYPTLHQKFTDYSFLAGVISIVVIIILFKLVYTLHSNFFSWSFRFLYEQFTGDFDEDDEDDLEY